MPADRFGNGGIRHELELGFVFFEGLRMLGLFFFLSIGSKLANRGEKGGGDPFLLVGDHFLLVVLHVELLPHHTKGALLVISSPTYFLVV